MQTPTDLKYTVKSIREHGLACKWTRTRSGAPIIVGRMPDVGGGKWYFIDDRTWVRAKTVGIVQAFEEHNALGAFFSIPV